MAEKTGKQGLYRNTVSYFGGLTVVVSLLLIILFLLLSFGLRAPSPYIGIFTYMIFPVFLILGVLIFLFGLLYEARRRRRQGLKEALPYPVLNLNDFHQRRRFTIALAGGSICRHPVKFCGL